jgi:hypothetical protein
VIRDNQPRDVREADATGGWWPSRYGPDDQAGALNEITPEVVRQAVTLVRHGPVYDLARMSCTRTCPPSRAAPSGSI